MKSFSTEQTDTAVEMLKKFLSMNEDSEYHRVAKDKATLASYPFDAGDDLRDEVREADRIHTFRAKECYRNALLLSLHLQSAFVFGYLIAENTPMPVAHAWVFHQPGGVGLDPTISIGQPRDFPEMSHERNRSYVEIARLTPERAKDVIMGGDPFANIALYKAIAEAPRNGDAGLVFPVDATAI